jgi:hypothetical protein
MLNSSFTNNIGLLHGKMGVSILFFHYANYTKKKIYKDFAGDLIDEIYKEIHLQYPKDFKNGLCGIAWGIEYLIRHKFVLADPDEVLEDIDRQILEWDVRRIANCSLEKGLKGISYYVLSRCGDESSCFKTKNRNYIIDLIYSMRRQTPDAEILSTINQLDALLSKNKTPDFNDLIKQLIDKVHYVPSKVFVQARPWGISDNGLAGIALKMINNASL